MKQLLVVVDMQNDFVDGALGTAEAVAILPAVSEKIARHKGPVFVTLDTHGEDYLDTSEGKKLPVPHCIRGTRGWQLNEQVAHALEGKNPTVLEKPTFGCVALPEAIHSEVGSEPFSIELIGLCTDICVISNALLLKAHFPEALIKVDSACCAGVSPATHSAALSAMGCCQLEII